MCVKVRTVFLEYWRVAKMQNAPPRKGGVTWPVTLLVQIQPLQPMFRWFSGRTLLSYRRNSRSIRLRNSSLSAAPLSIDGDACGEDGSIPSGVCVVADRNHTNAGVVQLIEPRFCKPYVPGLSPGISSRRFRKAARHCARSRNYAQSAGDAKCCGWFWKTGA